MSEVAVAGCAASTHSQLPTWAAVLIPAVFVAALVIECLILEGTTRRRIRQEQLAHPTHYIHRI